MPQRRDQVVDLLRNAGGFRAKEPRERAEEPERFAPSIPTREEPPERREAPEDLEPEGSGRDQFLSMFQPRGAGRPRRREPEPEPEVEAYEDLEEP